MSGTGSDIDILRRLMKENMLAPIKSDEDGKGVVVLKECGNKNQAEYSIQINDMPRNSIVINADKTLPLDRVFKSDKGVCKRADFILIANEASQRWIIFIELKKRLGERDQIIQQLKGAQCFIAYCRSIGQMFWEKKDFLDERNYINRFVSIKLMSTNKEPTRRSSVAGEHNHPEDMLELISSDDVMFKDLI